LLSHREIAVLKSQGALLELKTQDQHFDPEAAHRKLSTQVTQLHSELLALRNVQIRLAMAKGVEALDESLEPGQTQLSRTEMSVITS
jgi:hypothetical protein